MEIIAFANQKGGVAKTTTTYNIAAALAEAGKRVLMVDLDPQASLTISCGMVPGENEHSICTVLDNKEKIDSFECGYQVEKSGLENLYIIPSDILLAETEQIISSKMARDTLLKKALKSFNGEMDYILIDCPPQLGILTTNALVAADKIIIPTKAEYLSYRGIKSLKNSISNVVESELNDRLEFAGFIVTMFEARINDHKDLLEVLEKEGRILGVVKKSADTYRNILDGKPVVLANKASDIAKTYGKIAEMILKGEI